MLSMTYPWFVFYTLPKQEKKVYNLVQQKRHEAYLPTQIILRQWSDRKKKVVVPLFPNYVFIRSQPTRINDILNTPGIVRVLTEDRQPVPIPEEEIERIKVINNGENEVEVKNYVEGVPVGTIVKIKNGPFTGLQGHIVRNKGNCRLIVELKFLSKFLQVEIPTMNTDLRSSVLMDLAI